MRTITIVTPENVELQFTCASPFTRAMAAFIDSLIKGVLQLLLALALFGSFTTRMREQSMREYALAIALVFVIEWGYHVIFETVWKGQTPGKRAMNIRVMKASGHPVDFVSVLIRNLLRVTMLLPVVNLVELIVVLRSDHIQRIGDYAAGTFVASLDMPVQSKSTDEALMELPVHLQQAVPFIDDELKNALAEYAFRRPQLRPDTQENLDRRFMALIEQAAPQLALSESEQGLRVSE
ncbi:MAG: RDD family protein [Armatimonadota bacterium]